MIGSLSCHERAWVTWPTWLLLPSLLWLAGCDGRGPQTLPGPLVGEWRTDEPRYHGRFMKLESDQITFGLGGVASDKSEHIERVSLAPGDHPTDYTIRLKAGDGTPDSIVLQFIPENGGELRLKNLPKVVWKRHSEPARTLSKNIPQDKTPPRETLPLDRMEGEHRTIYKIDCLQPKACRSY